MLKIASAITHRPIFRFQQNGKNCQFRKSKMAYGCHFEIIKAQYLNDKLSDFDELWCAEINSDKDGSHFTEIQNLQNSRRRTAAMLKSLYAISQ